MANSLDTAPSSVFKVNLPFSLKSEKSSRWTSSFESSSCPMGTDFPLQTSFPSESTTENLTALFDALRRVAFLSIPVKYVTWFVSMSDLTQGVSSI